MTDKEMFDIAKPACRMLQQESEILWALREIRHHFGDYQPEIFVELGCHGGGSLCMWSQLLDGGTPIGIGPVPNQDMWLKRLYSIIGDNVLLINGLSENSVGRLEGILQGRKIDGLFIDTVHTYKQTMCEWMLYEKFIGSPGIAGFHDIAVGINNAGTGEFWNDIKYDYNYIEKHDKIGNDRFGIGMLLL